MNNRSLLYVFSGSDTCPVQKFLQFDQFVYIDEHPFFDLNDDKAQLVDKKLISNIKKGLGYEKIPQSVGYFGPTEAGKYGYDYTDVYGYMNYRMEIDLVGKKSHEIGLSHLLISRLKELCAAFEIKVSCLVPNTVYQIDFQIDGKNKQIIYIREKLGENKEGFNWLISQNPIFEVFLTKGFPHKNDSNEQQYLDIIRSIYTLTQKLTNNKTVYVTDSIKYGPFPGIESITPLKHVTGKEFGYNDNEYTFSLHSVISQIPQSML